MRILIWSSAYAPGIGGVEVVVQGLARSLADRGRTVEVVAQSVDDVGASTLEPEGIIHRLPFHQVLASRDPARVVALTQRVAEIKRKFAPDLIHAHAVHPSEFFLLRTADVARCPTLFTVHGWTPMASGHDTLRNRMFRHVDWIVGCCRYVTDQTIRTVPDVAARCVTIPTGYRDPGVRLEALPSDPPRLLCVGRLVESKGFQRVLQALPALLRAEPATRLTIVGAGPFRHALEQECDRLQVRAQTTFVGAVPRDRVFGYMLGASMCIIPSADGSEGLNLVALEAALMERPVVATRDGGLSEAVVDGETGFLVDGGDREALERSILTLLADPELAARFGRAGRRFVLDSFGWDRHVADHLTLYEMAAAGCQR
jgi:glycogen synthase